MFDNDIRVAEKMRNAGRVFGGRQRQGSEDPINEQPSFEERPSPEPQRTEEPPAAPRMETQPQPQVPSIIDPGPFIPAGAGVQMALAPPSVQQPVPVRMADSPTKRMKIGDYNYPRVTSVEVVRPAPRGPRAVSPRRYGPTANFPIGSVSTIYRPHHKDDQPRGIPSKLVSVPQTHTAAEVDQLKEEIRQRDATIAQMQSRQTQLVNDLHDKTRMFEELVMRFKRSQTSLQQALDMMQQKQLELQQLRQSLVTEVSDNDTLKNGFVNLIRKAQFELKSLRDELDYRDRKERYARNLDTPI